MTKRFIQYGVFATFAMALATSGVAYAQPEDDMGGEMGEEDPLLGEEPEAGDDLMADDTGAEADTAAAEADSAMEVVGAWPQQRLARPLTLPKGMFSAGTDVLTLSAFDAVALAAPPVETVGVLGALSGGLTFAYGVDDKLEVGGTYSMVLKEFEAKGAVLAHAAYNVLRDDKLDVSVNGQLGYDVFAEGLAPLGLGAKVKFMLNDKMALLTPGSQVVISLTKTELGLGMATAEIQPMFIRLPVGFGFQATPELSIEAYTQIAVIELKDTESGFIFADFIPVQARAFYSLGSQMDIGAGAFVDFKAEDIGESLGFLASFRYYGGA